jgi:hypothetical protein
MNCKYSQSLKEAYNNLSRSLPEAFAKIVRSEYHLNPDRILDALSACNYDVSEGKQVAFWIDLEKNPEKYSFRDLFFLLQFDSFFLADRGCFIITDDGISNGEIFYVKKGEEMSFVEWYEDHYNILFFQAQDYLMFNPSYSKWTILHHSGIQFSAISE